jgi:hypothetical protein
MKPTKKMIKWMLRSLIAAGILNGIGIAVGIFIDSPLLVVVMLFNAIVMRLAYNNVKAGR